MTAHASIDAHVHFWDPLASTIRGCAEPGAQRAFIPTDFAPLASRRDDARRLRRGELRPEREPARGALGSTRFAARSRASSASSPSSTCSTSRARRRSLNRWRIAARRRGSAQHPGSPHRLRAPARVRARGAGGRRERAHLRPVHHRGSACGGDRARRALPRDALRARPLWQAGDPRRRVRALGGAASRVLASTRASPASSPGCSPRRERTSALRRRAPLRRAGASCFGAARLMYGSDWPVATLGGGAELWRTIVDELSADWRRGTGMRSSARTPHDSTDLEVPVHG